MCANILWQHAHVTAASEKDISVCILFLQNGHKWTAINTNPLKSFLQSGFHSDMEVNPYKHAWVMPVSCLWHIGNKLESKVYLPVMAGSFLSLELHCGTYLFLSSKHIPSIFFRKWHIFAQILALPEDRIKAFYFGQPKRKNCISVFLSPYPFMLIQRDFQNCLFIYTLSPLLSGNVVVNI